MPNALLALLLAAPAAALVTGSHTWRVPSERIASGEPIESEPFSCAGQTWSLKLSPRGPRRCGVELRYAANDVGDAVDAAFTLSVGASSEEGGLTFVHPLAAGVLDGEATTYETELELEDDVIEVNSEIQVYAASSDNNKATDRQFSTFRHPEPAVKLARRTNSPLPLALARLPRLVRAGFAAPDAVRNGLRVGHVVVPVLVDGGAPDSSQRGVAPLGADGLPSPPESLEQCEALREQTLFMLKAGLQAWGVDGGDARTRSALGARGVLPGADYRVESLELADGTRVARLPDGVSKGVKVALQPIMPWRFRGAPAGGWPATLELDGVDACDDGGEACATLWGDDDDTDASLALLTQPGFAAATATAAAGLGSTFAALALFFCNCFSLTYIPTTSMVPTLQPGDVVLQDRFFTGTGFGPIFLKPKVGDMVFFEPPPALKSLVDGVDNKQFVKRVAAVEGDAVRVAENGDVYVKGVPRPGLCDPKTGRKPQFAEAKGRVPRGTIYVLGDCPGNSVDSRSWGNLPVDLVTGRPLVRLWPLTRFGPI